MFNEIYNKTCKMYNTPLNNQLIFSTIHCFVSPWNTSPKTIFCENSHQSAKTFEIFFWKEKNGSKHSNGSMSTEMHLVGLHLRIKIYRCTGNLQTGRGRGVSRAIFSNPLFQQCHRLFKCHDWNRNPMNSILHGLRINQNLLSKSTLSLFFFFPEKRLWLISNACWICRREGW